MSTRQNPSVGDKLPELHKEMRSLQLFRFSAITWNPHRIHYDRTHAEREGHPDILVQAHLHGAIIQELLLDWIGPDGRLLNLSWRNVGRATADSTLVAGGEIAELNEEDGTVTVDIWTESGDERCTEGTARLERQQ